MDIKRAMEDAERLVKWCDLNGQPDKPITFPSALKKRVIVDVDGKWNGHPVRFLDPPQSAKTGVET